jgi:hypothetical protein
VRKGERERQCEGDEEVSLIQRRDEGRNADNASKRREERLSSEEGQVINEKFII